MGAVPAADVDAAAAEAVAKSCSCPTTVRLDEF